MASFVFLKLGKGRNKHRRNSNSVHGRNYGAQKPILADSHPVFDYYTSGRNLQISRKNYETPDTLNTSALEASADWNKRACRKCRRCQYQALLHNAYTLCERIGGPRLA
jgi:hypothetical protein